MLDKSNPSLILHVNFDGFTEVIKYILEKPQSKDDIVKYFKQKSKINILHILVNKLRVIRNKRSH
jgi:hypothetical protein